MGASVKKQSVGQADRLRLLLRWGYNLSDIEVYGFGSGRAIRDAPRFLGHEWFMMNVQPLMNDASAKPFVTSKWVFYRLLESFGLPAPRTLGLFDPVYGVTWDAQRPMRTVPEVLRELDERRPAGLVLKPVGGGQGSQLLILNSIDYSTGRAVTRAGGETNLEDALVGLDPTGLTGFSGYIVQEPLAAHEFFDRLAPWTTNTIRIQTVLGSDGTVAVQAAVVRLGRRGRMGDNWHQGGLSVGIDSSTGTMGRGVVRPEYGGVWYTSHPDSNVPFTGVTVPFWDEAVDVCRRAARLYPGLRSLGWDIVITPDGPVVLEANAWWGIQSLQVHSDGFLADPVFRAQVEDFRAPLPDGGVTGAVALTLSRAKRRIMLSRAKPRLTLSRAKRRFRPAADAASRS